MLKEFKKFIARGNVMDLAVGVIIGDAFSKIVSSLVNDILMPIIGGLIGGFDFTNLSFHIGNATITYGNFIQNIVDFLIVAFVIFLVIKLINNFNDKMEAKMKKLEEKLGKKEEEEAPKKEEIPEDIKLLREINNNLKKLNKKD